MINSCRAIVVGALLAVFLTQGFHRHVQHEAGVYRPHVDCITCAWSVGAHAPALSGGGEALSMPGAAGDVAVPAAAPVPRPSHSVRRSRAPPLSVPPSL